MSNPPSVTGISPNEGHPGTKIVIRGENLGRTQLDLMSVVINDDECVASAEWHSPTKITARCGRNQGTGPVIVITRSGGRGTCTVSFRVYTTRIGLTTEVGYWYDEAKQWEARRGRIMFINESTNPTTGTLSTSSSSAVDAGGHRAVDDANPLGLDDPGEQVFGDEQLAQMFPESCGDLNFENFSSAWYILQHHSTASLRDLERALRLREERKRRERETSTNDMVLYVKDFLVSFFECVDTLDHLDARIGDDRRKLTDAIDGLNKMCTKMQQDIQGTFGEIFARRRNIIELKKIAAVASKYAYLWNTLASINRARQSNNFALLIDETRKLDALLEQVPASVFKQIMQAVNNDTAELNRHLQEQLSTSTVAVPLAQEQIHLSTMLNALGATGYDPLWSCIKKLHLHTIEQMRVYFNNNVILFAEPTTTIAGNVDSARNSAVQLPKTAAYLTRKAYFESNAPPAQQVAEMPSLFFYGLIASFIGAELSSSVVNNNASRACTPIVGVVPSSSAAVFAKLPALLSEWTRTLFDLAVKRCEHMMQLWMRCNHRRAAADEKVNQSELQQRFHTLVEAVVCQTCITIETLLRSAVARFRKISGDNDDEDGMNDSISALGLKARHLVVVQSSAQAAIEQFNDLTNRGAYGDTSAFAAGVADPFAGALQHLRYFTRGAGIAIAFSVLQQAKDDARLCCLTALLNINALALLPGIYQILLHKALHSLQLIADNDNAAASVTASANKQQPLRCFSNSTAELISRILQDIIEMPLAVFDVNNMRTGNDNLSSSLADKQTPEQSKMLLSLLGLIKLRYSIVPAMLHVLQTDLLLSTDLIHQVELKAFQLYGDRQTAISTYFVETTVEQLFVHELRVKIQSLSALHGGGDIWTPSSAGGASPARECFVAFLMRILQRMNDVTALVLDNMSSSKASVPGDANAFQAYGERSHQIIESFLSDYNRALAMSLAQELNRYVRMEHKYSKTQAAAILACIYIVQNSLQRFLSDDGHFLLNAASEWVLECLESAGGRSNMETVKTDVVRLVKVDVDKFFEDNVLLLNLSMLAEVEVVP